MATEMVRIKLLKPRPFYKVGEVIEVSLDRADRWAEQGVAKLMSEPTRASIAVNEQKEDTTRGTRTRTRK